MSSHQDNESTKQFKQLFARYKAQVLEEYSLLVYMENQESEKSKPTILVIEDNADEWFLMRWAFLQYVPQAESVWIGEPQKVISYLDNCLAKEQDLPKLIVLDLYLPSAQEGIRLLQMLKSHIKYNKIPVIILSRSFHPDDIAESMTYAANSYIVKPTNYSGWLETFIEFRKYLSEIISNDRTGKV